MFFASTIGDEALKKKVGELARVCDEAYYSQAEPVHFREQISMLLPGGQSVLVTARRLLTAERIRWRLEITV